jgi:hypothetical protein
MTLTFQVGLVTAIDPADPVIEDERKATLMALTESVRDETGVYGVWTGQEAGSDLLYIAHMGQLFRSV